MVRLLSRSVAVLIIVALSVNFAFAWVETIGPKNAEIAKWKESMRGVKATERIVAPTVNKMSKYELNDPELVPFKNIQTYDYEFNIAENFEAYIDYTRPGYGGFIFEGTDSLGVWFRPATDCNLLKIQVLFHAESGMLGDALTVNVNDVKDELPTPVAPQVSIDGNGLYGFTEYMKCIPSPRGTLLGSYPMNVTQVGFNLETGWSEANLTALGGAIDIGKRDFFVSLAFPVGNDGSADVYYGPGEEQHAEGDYHSFKWYHTGGTYSPGTPNWVSRLNFTMRVVVDYYGDPPPFIEDVTALSSVYASCDPGPYEVSAKVYDLGTATFTGAVTKVNLIYFTEAISDADTVDITANVVGDIYTGEIPGHAVGTNIWYYIYAEDNGLDGEGVTHWSRTAPKSFQVIEGNPDATILVIGDGANDVPAMFTDIMDEGGWIYDLWDTGVYGYPTQCVIDNYSSLFWLQGQGSGGLLSDGLDNDIVAPYLDAGGNLFLVSADYIGIVEENFDGNWVAATYGFLINYLKVADFASDVNVADPNVGNSTDSLYMGVAANVISGFMGEDTLMLAPITFMGAGGYNYADEVTPTTDASYPFVAWSEGDNDWVEAATMFDGTFKMVFIPWYLEAATDMDMFGTIVKNVLGFFGEKAAPLAGIESGPRYCVAANSGPYAVVATASDGDGTVAGVELGTSTDGVSFTYTAMTAGAGVYEGSIPALSVDDTLFYKVKATDNDGLNGYAGPWAFNMIDFTPVNTGLLYCGDDPYDWYYGGNVDSIVIASLDRIGASYDMYDVDANGYIAPSYIGFLDQYTSVIWHGYADWEMSFPYATADNPFMPFIEAGGNLLFSSEEMIGTHLGWSGYVTTHPGQAVYDVLGVSWYAPDMAYDSLRIYPGSAGVGMDAILSLAELPFGHMEDIVDPVDWDAIPLLDAFVPGWGVWYSAWDCYTAWWEKDAYPGSQRVIVPFCLAAMNDFNRDAFLTNVIAGFVSGVAIDDAVETLPKAFALKQNFPNPFNPVTSIAFEMPSDQNVRLTVYNMLGQNVRTLVNDQRSAGRYTILWDGRDNSGHMVGSGVYFYQIQAGSFTKTAKMVFLK
ncbi:T9SS type A sorting domain-containing protein [bacterium]|nr:T9SS type A sorting domain-containing protein [bacterium]MBU1635149.1 T9SS type A sorting domain-containing protein [bacterium]MBU1872849.1 T9SS type A sorting domain-containing protein [bacterium]